MKRRPFVIASVAALLAAFGCSASGNAIQGVADGGADASADAPLDVTAATSDDGAALDDAAVDAGVVDDASSPLACPPGSVAAFTPTWKPPKKLHAGVCSLAEAELTVDCAFDPNAKQSTCDAYFADAGSSACTLCVLTDDFDTTYGPIVMHGAYAALNLGGCIAQTSGDTSATSCGAKVQAISECQEFACTSCPDPSTTSKAMTDYLKCQGAAMSSVCKSFVTAGSCADALIAPDGSAEICASGGNTFLDRARALARLFCAP
ncbi:MAG: hypothetical protein U0235_02540 [Polyangiaceae bacterium]